MKRALLKKLLNKYNPTCREEVEFKKQIISFIENNVDCFERSLQIGHITASCWLLSKDKQSALLMHHAKLNQWFQLGGHCDGDSDVMAVAIKEAQEESGICEIIALSNDIFDIDVHLIPENSREKAHYHYDIRFLLKVAGDQAIMQNNESKELRWFKKRRDELPTESPSVLRMFDKWMNLP